MMNNAEPVIGGKIERERDTSMQKARDEVELKNPQDFLNQDAWEVIIEKLQDPLDKLHLAQTNSWFDSKFHSKISQWHFPAVLPIVLNYFESNPIDRDLKAAFLTCRLITKPFCWSVDRYIEDYWRRYNYKSLPSFARCNQTVLRLSGEQKLEEFFQLYHSYYRRGIQLLTPGTEIHGSLHIHEPEPSSSKRNLFQELIQLGGYNLHKVHLNITIAPNVTIEVFLNNIINLLNSLPRVRQLKLNITSEGFFNQLEEDSEERFNALPCPNLGHLKELSILCDQPSIPFASYFPLKKCHAKLTVLHLHFSIWRWKFEGDEDYFFPKLKMLTFLTIPKEEAEWEIHGFFRYLETPKLEQVCYEWKSSDEEHAMLTEQEIKSAYQIMKNSLHDLMEKYPEVIWETETDNEWRRSCIFFNGFY